MTRAGTWVYCIELVHVEFLCGSYIILLCSCVLHGEVGSNMKKPYSYSKLQFYFDQLA